MPPALDSIFVEIERALNARLYYVALAVTLTIPEICAGAELDLLQKNVKSGDYIAWCDRYIKNLGYLSGEDVYHLRGGLIHTGFFSHRFRKFDRPYFSVPGTGFILHGNVSEGNAGDPSSSLSLDLATFIKDIKSGAEAWYAEKKDDPQVIENTERLVCFRPEGLPAYGINVPVVA